MCHFSFRLVEPLLYVRLIPPRNGFLERTAGSQEAEKRGNEQLATLSQETSGLQDSVLERLDTDFQTLVATMNERLPSLVMALVKRVLVDVKMDVDTVKAIIEGYQQASKLQRKVGR